MEPRRSGRGEGHGAGARRQPAEQGEAEDRDEEGEGGHGSTVIASEAKQSSAASETLWIASSLRSSQ
jgi:hypothetical protein